MNAVYLWSFFLNEVFYDRLLVSALIFPTGLGQGQEEIICLQVSLFLDDKEQYLNLMEKAPRHSEILELDEVTVLDHTLSSLKRQMMCEICPWIWWLEIWALARHQRFMLHFHTCISQHFSEKQNQLDVCIYRKRFFFAFFVVVVVVVFWWEIGSYNYGGCQDQICRVSWQAGDSGKLTVQMKSEGICWRVFSCLCSVV